MKIHHGLLIIIFGQIPVLHAQPDVIFKHTIASGTYYNPSFAGMSEKYYAITLNDRSGKESGHNANSICFSLDRYFNPIRGGIGIVGYYNQVYYKSTAYCGFLYASKFSIDKKLMISPSIKIGYSWHRLDFNKIIDDSIPGFDYDSLDYYYLKSKIFPELSFGLLLNTNRIYLGLAVDHIKERVINFCKTTPPDNLGKDNLSRKYIVQLGYNRRANDEAWFSFNPNLLYQYQKNNSSLFINNYFRYKYFLLGLGYERRIDDETDKVFLGAGFTNTSFTFGVSYDFPMSKLNNTSENALETSIKYFFGSKK